MKKFLLSTLSLLILSSTIFALEIKDDKIVDPQGNAIEKKKYNKIVLTDPAFVEMFYLIGGEETISAIGKTTRSQIHPVEKTEKLPSIGTITKPNLEEIIALEPDLVIINTMTSGIVDSLKKVNIPVIQTQANSINDILNNINIAGILTGQEENATKLYNESKAKVEKLRDDHKDKPKIKGVVLFSTSPMMTFSAKSLPGEILELLAVDNLAKDVTGDRPIISNEFLIAENPDFVAGAMSFKSADEIKNSNPALAETKAFKNNNIFIIDSNKILRGSPRIFEALEEFSTELSNLKLD